MREMIFISSPYMAYSYEAIDRNIQQAKRAAVALAELRVPFFCPHLHTAHFETLVPQVPESFFLQLDLQILEHCTGIYMLHNWRYSEGCQAEYARAKELNLHIFYHWNELAIWATNKKDKLTNDQRTTD